MRRGLLGCLWMILKPVLLLGTFVVLIGVLAFPWGIPLPGRDTLTGEWAGELRSNSGPRAWLYVDLDVAPGYRGKLGGSRRRGESSALCTSRRRIDLDVTGYTTAWSGKTLELLLTPVAPSPPELRFDVTGTWDGHTLELRETDRSLADALGEPSDKPAVESRSAPQWIAATLRRGTRSAFDSACATLATSR